VSHTRTLGRHLALLKNTGPGRIALLYCTASPAVPPRRAAHWISLYLTRRGDDISEALALQEGGTFVPSTECVWGLETDAPYLPPVPYSAASAMRPPTWRHGSQDRRAAWQLWNCCQGNDIQIS